MTIWVEAARCPCFRSITARPFGRRSMAPRSGRTMCGSRSSTVRFGRTQQGSRPRRWTLEFPLRGAPQSEPMMGWAAGSDSSRLVRLTDSDRDGATAFAERNGWRDVLYDAPNRLCAAPTQFFRWKTAPIIECVDAPDLDRIRVRHLSDRHHRPHWGTDLSAALQVTPKRWTVQPPVP